MAVEIAVADLMDIRPIGGRDDEVGRLPQFDAGREFDHADHDVVGECVECGHDVHAAVTGHVCADGFRRHRNGEGIAAVEEAGA